MGFVCFVVVQKERGRRVTGAAVERGWVEEQETAPKKLPSVFD